MLVAFNRRDARKISEWYRDKEAISPERPQVDPFYLREVDLGNTSGIVTANSSNNVVNSIYRPESGSAEGSFQYTNVINPWAAEIADDTKVVVARLWTGEWIILTADCPDP
jgi:hypothetical protein